jgi:hypothetical protein
MSKIILASRDIMEKKYFITTIILCCVFIYGYRADAAEKAPKWVTDYNSVYPESQWVCVVESASNKAAATAAAQNSLAKTFNVDVKGVTSAMQSMSQTVSGSSAAFSKNSAISQQVEASTDVSGLMGVISDAWTASDGTVHVISRMNRKNGAATYTGIIKENDKVISSFIKDAKNKPNSFEAYEGLSIASGLAVLTDNYLNILSVLNPSERSAVKVSYGNAPSVKKLAEQCASGIIIVIEIEHNFVNEQAMEIGRIKKAFAQVFTKRGFRTSDNANDNSYTLDVKIELSPVVLNGNPDKFIRYEITASLEGSDGTEIMAYSGDAREGHLNYNEAIQRSIRAAERSIGDTDNEDSFINAFDTFLVSLLD